MTNDVKHATIYVKNTSYCFTQPASEQQVDYSTCDRPKALSTYDRQKALGTCDRQIHLRGEVFVKRSKILVCLMLALVLVVGMAGSAMAASFNFHFVPPYKGSARNTGSETANGNPYVDPDGASGAIAETTFVIRFEGADVSRPVRSTGAKKTFSYEPGFGGSGQKYYMRGAPSNSDFQEYVARGSWQP